MSTDSTPEAPATPATPATPAAAPAPAAPPAAPKFDPKEAAKHYAKAYLVLFRNENAKREHANSPLLNADQFNAWVSAQFSDHLASARAAHAAAQAAKGAK